MSFTLSFEATALSPREAQVLKLIADGLHNEEIGQQLLIATETVKSHVKHILSKLGARTRAQAVAIGYEEGLLGG